MKTIFITLSLILLTFASCESIPVAQNDSSTNITSGDNTQIVVEPNTSADRIALYWESTTEKHPERKPWSDAIHANTEKYFDIYDSAKDATRFCPKYKSLSKDFKKKAIGEFLVALSYYESTTHHNSSEQSWNPLAEAVDVGTKNDKGSWSVGLFQMSGNDEAAKALKVDYLGLKDPIKNINVAMYQFNTQIKNTGLFILPNSSKYRYWAVALDGNKYSKVASIIERVLKNAPNCK